MRLPRERACQGDQSREILTELDDRRGVEDLGRCHADIPRSARISAATPRLTDTFVVIHRVFANNAPFSPRAGH
jgi:hypothetical protein